MKDRQSYLPIYNISMYVCMYMTAFKGDYVYLPVPGCRMYVYCLDLIVPQG